MDILYDATILENPVAVESSSLVSADKSLGTGTPQPGVFRLVAFGLNPNVIPNGEVAVVSFDIKSDASPGTTPLPLTNLASTDPDGNGLDVVGNDGSIDVTT